MAGRLFTCVYTGTLTNAGGNADLFTFLPADDKPIALEKLRFSQTSEVQDAAEEILDIDILHMTATVTDSNGTSVTPNRVQRVDTVAAGFTCKANGATVATTSGTTTTMDGLGWNERATPYEVAFTDLEDGPYVARQTEALVVRCNSTVADDVSIKIAAWVREY